ncbi:MAG: hypothetical protein HKO62_06640 [Gammaproteobacteria bacterium]|nr:hypothetical protein [Gammaproteobacteria bacterium]
MSRPALYLVEPAVRADRPRPRPSPSLTRSLALLALRAELAGREHRQLSALVRELVAETRSGSSA